MAEVIRIEPCGYQNGIRKLRTCAYCRVSSDSADQLNSYSKQVSYYTKSIKANSDYDFVDVFADKGITGTRADQRVEFQRMIKLCEQGKIDLIITKSISRFARNVPECLDYVRKLKRLGVGVIFEKESINTLRLGDELMLSTFSAIAQEESLAISQRLRQANIERMKRGEYVAGTSPFGYRMVNKELQIYEPEAEIVRDIFRAYLSGASINELARDMTNKNVEKRNVSDWNYVTVHYILTNEKYIGNTMFQKTYTTETLPFIKRINKGHKDKYYAEGTHDAIIDRETFERVQKLLKERSNQYGFSNPNKSYPLTKKLRCQICGANFVRRTNKGNTIWSCSNHEKGKEKCAAKRFREEDIYNSFIRMFNKIFSYNRSILKGTLKQLEYIIDNKKRNNSIIKEQNKSLIEFLDKKMMLEQLRNKGYVKDEMYYAQIKAIENSIKACKAEKEQMLETQMEETYHYVRKLTETVLMYGKKMVSFDSEIYDKIVKQANVSPDGTIEFELIGGMKFKERI